MDLDKIRSILSSPMLVSSLSIAPETKYCNKDDCDLEHLKITVSYYLANGSNSVISINYDKETDTFLILFDSAISNICMCITITSDVFYEKLAFFVTEMLLRDKLFMRALEEEQPRADQFLTVLKQQAGSVVKH